MINLCSILPALSIIVAALSPILAESDLLSLDFNNSGPGYQPAPLVEAEFQGDLALSTSIPGTLDLGANGYLVVPQFTPPTGPFTVETGFRLREYGADTATFSTVLLNAVAGGQGFSLRIGGGPGYPIHPKAELPYPAIWALDDSTSVRNRAAASSCAGAFSMLGPNGLVMEAYTRFCVQPGEWVSLTATWDGQLIHLYVNGEEATDGTRKMGYGATPLRPEQLPVFIGAADRSGARHFNGQLDFVRVLDRAMLGAEILQRYKDSGRAEDPAYDCQGAILPKPIVVQGGCDLTFSKVAMDAYDSMEVQFSKDSDFKSLFTSYRVPVKYFRHSDHEGRVSVLEERLFWRARIVRGTAPPIPTPEIPTPQDTTPVVVVPVIPTPQVPTPEVPNPQVPTPQDTTPKVVTPEVPVPQDTTPKVVTPQVPTPQDTVPQIPTRIQVRTFAWNGSGSIHIPFVPGARMPGLYRTDGSSIPSVAVRIGANWELQPVKPEPGLVLVRIDPAAPVKASGGRSIR